MKYEIDAKNKILGRIAAEAASVLRGKNDPNFAPNKLPDVEVIVSNIDSIKVSGKKMKQKKYSSYSGYPGGLKKTVMKEAVEKKGLSSVFINAVKGMLPNNKLRKEAMKKLTVK